MIVSHNAGINRRFSRSASSYDDHADIQRRVAETLCDLIDLPAPSHILELGCGTGFLTLPLIKKYPESRFTITDLSAEMLARTRQKIAAISPASPQDIHFKPLDFTQLDKTPGDSGQRYDLITASMVLHWGGELSQTLNKLLTHLNPGGKLYFSTIGPDTFPEWQAVLRACNYPSGLRTPHALQGVIKRELISRPYGNAASFLKELRETGAHGPKDGYTPLSPAKLKHAMHLLEKEHQATLTWEICYACHPSL